MDPPTFLQIEPVGQCNLSCTMCPISLRSDRPQDGTPAFLKFDTFLRVLDQWPQVAHLHLQGLGEPMLHPRFFEMVAVAVARGMRVTTNTNLTVLSRRRAECCVTSGLETIHVSIDSASAEGYAAIRVGGRLDRVLRNVGFLIEARERLGSSLPRLRLVAVVMRKNLDELSDLVRLASRFGIEAVFVQHLCHDFGESQLPPQYMPMRRYVDEQTLLHEPPERIAASFAAARLTARELGVELRLPELDRTTDRGGTGRDRCDWPWRGGYVSYQGFMMPCCMISTPDRLNFGNVSDETLPLIWNGESYEAFRNRLASADPPDVCRSCSVYHGVF